LSRDTDGIHVTSILHAIGWSSGDVIRTIYCNNILKLLLKMPNKNLKTTIWASLRFSGSCGIKSVAYLLNMICLNLLILYKIVYIWIFELFLQFYISFSRQKHQIDDLYVSFNAWVSQVSSYTPFDFSFTVPLNSVKSEKQKRTSKQSNLINVSSRWGKLYAGNF